MPTIRIGYATDGRHVDVDEEIEAETVAHVHGRCRIVLDWMTGRKLMQLFGDRYMETVFHLVDGATMFRDCRIAKMGPSDRCAIDYTTTAPVS